MARFIMKPMFAEGGVEFHIRLSIPTPDRLYFHYRKKGVKGWGNWHLMIGKKLDTAAGYKKFIKEVEEWKVKSIRKAILKVNPPKPRDINIGKLEKYLSEISG